MKALREMILFFHGLAGLCFGWLWGMRAGFWAGATALVAGCNIGLIVGFLVSRLPGALRLLNADISRRLRFLAGLFVVCGLTAGVVFWSLCFHCVHD
jgi:hypothetical protein